MAKDVDLSSREWRDLVFEGKNKSFGAYTLRANSVRRHTKSLLWVLGVLAALLLILVLVLTGALKFGEDETEAQNEAQATTVDMGDVEEEQPEEEQIDIPEPEPEPVQEEIEVAASQAVTELKIVDEVDKSKEVKNVDEVLDNTAQIGATDAVGKEDVNKEAIVVKVVEKEPEPVKPKHEEPVMAAMVEQKPLFPGGDAAMYAWLKDHIVYPAAASEEGISGKVTVQFIVEKDGRITGVKVVRGKHPALDAEAKRVVSQMPKWTPGRNNGQPVRVTYHIPVNFQLK